MKKAAFGLQKKSVKAPQALNDPLKYAKPVPFSRGIRVDLENSTLVFISGTASINNQGKTVHRKDFVAQVGQTFKNLTALLKSEGSAWQDVVKTTCYLKSMSDYDAFNRLRYRFYRQQKVFPFPASTCVEAKLCRPDLLVEIELIAIRKHGR